MSTPGREPGPARPKSPASESERVPAHGRRCCNCDRPNPDPNRPFLCHACAYVQWVLPTFALELMQTYVAGRRLVVKPKPPKKERKSPDV